METSDGGKQQLPYLDLFLLFATDLPKLVFRSQRSSCYLFLIKYFTLINLSNWRLITIFWWVLPYIDMNQPQVYTAVPVYSHRCSLFGTRLFQTVLPPTSPSYPSGLSQCTSFECPVSSIELGLVIYFTYGNKHVSMLFSKIIPSSPSPTESKSLYFISVSLPSCIEGHCYHLSKFYHIYALIYCYWCFSF